jgi:hypothetical protein
MLRREKLPEIQHQIVGRSARNLVTIPTEQSASGLGNQSLIEQQKNSVRSRFLSSWRYVQLAGRSYASIAGHVKWRL